MKSLYFRKPHLFVYMTGEMSMEAEVTGQNFFIEMQ